MNLLLQLFGLSLCWMKYIKLIDQNSIILFINKKFKTSTYYPRAGTWKW